MDDKKHGATTNMIVPPEMTQEAYARLSGLKPGVVRGHVEKGLIATVKRGRHRLINTAKVFAENISS